MMDKRLLFMLIVMQALLTSCSWGGRTYYANYKTPVPQAQLDTRVTTLPFRVYDRDVPDLSDNWSAHYEFLCWMLPGERYTVLGGTVDGMRYIESGRCNGDAFVD